MNTSTYTEQQKELTKKELNEAIEHLQKIIRKGAVSNEYLHTGRVHKELSSVDAKK